MIDWTPQQIADAAGAELVSAGGGRADEPSGPSHAVIDSALAASGALFAGLQGANTDGGRFASDALDRGAWGVLAGTSYAQALADDPRGVVLAAGDPLAALQRLATAWRRELGREGATVIGVTGSTGKTTTKELIAAMGATVAPTHATHANFNTEIGLPLTVLAAPRGTRLLVLEMAMRGAGQIAELAQIAEPEIGVVVNVGPAHLELLGTIEAIAAEKASLLTHLPPGGTAIVPDGEPLLAQYHRGDLTWLTFGSVSGDQSAAGLPDALGAGGLAEHVRIDAAAALLAVRAAGLEPRGPLELTPGRGRGASLPGVGGSTVIDDCYNANPMSMRAALASLGGTPAERRVAVLGDMLELGSDELALHRALAEQAAEAGVALLVSVGERARAAADCFAGQTQSYETAQQAAAALQSQLGAGDVVLVKGSRGIGLEVVVDALSAVKG